MAQQQIMAQQIMAQQQQQQYRMSEDEENPTAHTDTEAHAALERIQDDLEMWSEHQQAMRDEMEDYDECDQDAMIVDHLFGHRATLISRVDKQKPGPISRV